LIRRSNSRSLGDHANRELVRFQRDCHGRAPGDRRQDPVWPHEQNIGYIAEYLTAVGVDLKEVRVVVDEEGAIVDALNALRLRCTCVFTTRGIGRSMYRSTPIRARSPSCANE